MGPSWIRALVGIIAFAVVFTVGLIAAGAIDTTVDEGTGLIAGRNTLILVSGIALLAGFIAYAGIEYAQTGRLQSISSQFDTRTIVLIPIAIAINIILGQTVSAALKVPVYLDSIGTILVGVLAGPIAGALTGGLANLIWTYILPAPFHSDYAAPFFIVAVEIGLLAGVFGRLGFFRSRPNSPSAQIGVGLVIVVAVLAAIGFWGLPKELTFFAPVAPGAEAPSPLFVILGWLVALLLVASALALVAYLILRRDVGVAYVFVAGLICGVVSAIISAPISAQVFGGVTGSGTDFLVAAFQAAGNDAPGIRPEAGPVVRPDRQDRHLRGRLRNPRRPEPSLHRPVPPRRASRRTGGGLAHRPSDHRRRQRASGRRRRLSRRAGPASLVVLSRAEPAHQGGPGDRRVHRRVRDRWLSRAAGHHRPGGPTSRGHRGCCRAARADLAGPDPANRDLGRPGERLHAGWDARAVLAWAV